MLSAISCDDGAMMTYRDSCALAMELADAAAAGPAEVALVVPRVVNLDGRSWLLLDEAVRSGIHGIPSGLPRTRALNLNDSTGLFAALRSFDRDGRVRQQATSALRDVDGRIASRALAVRLLDHVPQVRVAARAALAPRLDTAVAADVLGVLLAGQDRQHGPAALEYVRATLLATVSAADLVAELLGTTDRAVRRWSLGLGREVNALTPNQVLEIVSRDLDQWLARAAANWLLDTCGPRETHALLRARTEEVRLAAVRRLPEWVVAPELSRLLIDPSRRVREHAQYRARQQGVEVVNWYRETMADPAACWRVVAAGLDGLTMTGGPEDLRIFLAALHHPSARVRAAAVDGVGFHAAADVALSALGPVVLDPSARVGRAAARVLVQIGAPRGVVEAAWASPQVQTRRIGWWMSRAGGGWEKVEADLRATTDLDLAPFGQHAIRDWIANSAAATWSVLSDVQRDRLRKLLVAGSLDNESRRVVAFHARIELP